MRAVVLQDGRLEVRETPDPVPGEGELLLRIGLDEVPDALELTRRSEGPPRTVVHPNGVAAS